MHLRSQAVYLRPPERTDVETVRELSAASDLHLTTFPLQVPRNNSWFEERFLLETSDEASRYKFVVCRCDSEKIVGTVDVFNIDRMHGSCEIGYQVYEPAERRQGLGRESASLAIRWVFSILRLNRIEANVISSNTASKKMLETLGFAFEGTKREAVFLNREFLDLDVFALLLRDYQVD